MRIFKSVLHIRLVSSKEVLRSSSDQRCWIFSHCLKKAQFPWMAAECAPGKIHIDLYLSRCYHLHNAHEISAWQAYQKSQLFSGVTRKSSFLLYPKATRYCYSTQRALERLLETSGKMRLIFSLLSIVSPLASTGHIYWHQPASGLALGKYLALFLWELKRYLWFITEFCANAAKQNLMC